MVKTWSWNNAKTGQKPSATSGGTGTGTSSGGFVKGTLPYEMGDLVRVTIPYVLGEDGTPHMIIKSAPIHKVAERGFIELTGPKGGKYTPYSIRCMNALSQTSFEKGREIAERNQYCALCTLAGLQTSRRFASMEQEFGSVEGYKSASENEKKAFNVRMKDAEKVNSSYNSRDKKTNYETHMLVLVLTSETKEISGEFGTELVSRVKLGSDGLPLYTPTLLKVSEARLDKFQNALLNAGRSGILSGDKLHPFTDVDGSVVKTAFVDFQMEFPVRPQKMNSAADVVITAVASQDSVITPEFVQHVLDKSQNFIEKTDEAWASSHGNLQEFTNQEFENAMSDGGAHYNEMKSLYLTERDREHAYKILETAKGNNMFKKDEEGNSVATTTSTESAPEQAPTVEQPLVTQTEEEVIEPIEDLLKMDFDI